jgi:hypothetical protein
MPSLLFFAPCEKVLIDQNNTASMIAVMEELTVQMIAGVAVPAGAVIPMQWSVLSMWEQSSAWDKDRGFEQRTALVSPEGKILVEVVAPFTFDKDRFRVINQFVGMPVGETGLHKIKIWIRDVSDPPKEWREVGAFPLQIALKIAPPEVPPKLN